MTIAVSVLTFDPIKHGRFEMLGETLATLAAPWPDHMFLVDNGTSGYLDGTRGSFSINPYFKCDVFRVVNPPHTSSMGNNIASKLCVESGSDIVVLSDDDISWHPGWKDRLIRIYEKLPYDMKLVGCHIEADQEWNAISDCIDLGVQKVLVRSSTGSATWSFRAKDWSLIFPLDGNRQSGQDLAGCKKLTSAGYRIGQVNLATHIGENNSCWGNKSSKAMSKTDMEKYGL